MKKTRKKRRLHEINHEIRIMLDQLDHYNFQDNKPLIHSLERIELWSKKRKIFLEMFHK